MAANLIEITAAAIASTSNATTYASASFTPVANRLYLLAVTHSDAAPEATVPTVATTTGLTFVQIGSSIAYNTIASNVQRITLFRAMKASGLSAGTYTVTLGDAGTGCNAILSEVTQVVTTGTDGANAVTNNVTGSANAGANPSIAMGAFSSNDNGIFAAFGSSIATAATAPAGWTFLSNRNYATPTCGLNALWIGNNAQNALCTLASSDWGGVAVELVSEAVPAVRPPQPLDPTRRVSGHALLAAACVFVATVAPPADAAAGGSEGQLGPQALIQYVSRVGPVKVPVSTDTSSFPDRWLAHYPDRIWRGIVLPLGFTVAPQFVADVTDPPPAPRTWSPAYPDRVDPPRALRPAATPFHFWPADFIEPKSASWHPAFPDQLLPRLPVRTGASGWMRLGLAEDTPVVAPALSWYPSYPDRLLPPSGLSPSQAGGITRNPTTTFEETITLDKWHPSYPSRHFTLRLVPTGTHVWPIYLADITVLAPARSWSPRFPDAIFRPSVLAAHQRPFWWHPITSTTPTADAGTGGDDGATLWAKLLIQYQGITGIPFQTVAPQVEVAWWFSCYPAAINRPFRVTAPAFNIDAIWTPPPAALVPDITGAQPVYPDWFPPKPRILSPAFWMDRFSAPAGEVVPNQPLSFFPHQVHRRPAQLHTRVWAEPMFGVVIAVPVMSWTGRYLEPPPLRRPATLPPSTFTDPKFSLAAPAAAPDLSWSPQHRPAWLPLRRPVQTGWIGISWFVPDVTFPVTPLSWSPSYPTLPRRRLASYIAGVTTTAPLSTGSVPQFWVQYRTRRNH